jgi:hypothetical protein
MGRQTKNIYTPLAPDRLRHMIDDGIESRETALVVDHGWAKIDREGKRPFHWLVV